MIPPRQVRIVNELPNRLRLKARFLFDSSLDPDYMEAALEAIPGVENARLNHKAASVIVGYDGRS